jgi:hypothetical protein
MQRELGIISRDQGEGSDNSTQYENILISRMLCYKVRGTRQRSGWDAMLQAGRSRLRGPMLPSNFFNLSNPSRRAMTLGLTQPLAEMSTTRFLWGKVRPARKADNLTANCKPTVQIMWNPQHLTPLEPSKACYRDSFTLLTLFML